jgi:hypothetical protein
MQNLLGLHEHRLTGPGIATHPGLSDSASEISELPQLDPVALRQAGGDLVEDGLESQFHHAPGQMRMRLDQLL